jgi:hypothetical protein
LFAVKQFSLNSCFPNHGVLLDSNFDDLIS